jgi:peptide/nickel transport system permease protein
MSARDLAAIPGEPEHFVSTAPFDPTSATRLTPEQERFYLASQWMLMWWKFKRHRVAVVSGIILLLMYGSTLVTEVLVPYNLHTRHTDFIYAFRKACTGSTRSLRRAVRLRAQEVAQHGNCGATTPRTSRAVSSVSSAPATPTHSGDGRHVVPPRMPRRRIACAFLLGSDRLDATRCRASSYGARISLTMAPRHCDQLCAGSRHRGIAGYFGGWADLVIQRLIEIIRSFPELPLWMALSAVLPVTWSPILIYRHYRASSQCSNGPGLARAVARSSSRCARKTTARQRG